MRCRRLATKVKITILVLLGKSVCASVCCAVICDKRLCRLKVLNVPLTWPALRILSHFGLSSFSFVRDDASPHVSKIFYPSSLCRDCNNVCSIHYLLSWYRLCICSYYCQSVCSFISKSTCMPSDMTHLLVKRFQVSVECRFDSQFFVCIAFLSSLTQCALCEKTYPFLYFSLCLRRVCFDPKTVLGAD